MDSCIYIAVKSANCTMDSLGYDRISILFCCNYLDVVIYLPYFILLIIFSTVASTLRPNAIILLFSSLIWHPLYKVQIKLKPILKIILFSATILLILFALFFYTFEEEASSILEDFLMELLFGICQKPI